MASTSHQTALTGFVSPPETQKAEVLWADIIPSNRTRSLVTSWLLCSQILSLRSRSPAVKQNGLSCQIRDRIFHKKRAGLGFAGFVYRRCYGYRSCVFRRFIRYLINRCLINASFTASSVVITILSIDCVGFSDVSPSWPAHNRFEY